ncbi:unnamed protein product [Rodentolepis nana]|uniref:Rho-related GTP-binding protein RhoU n=1 Tax=Rodentolepis nana TaxID=102285 RepID=A0A0R3T291_RODNA|nr:unnamed protein product [Rodentolepis nana]
METPECKENHILIGKCVVVGDERVGKSCFISRLCGQPFRNTYSATLVDMAPVKTTKDGNLMLVDCWDTPGAHNLEKIRFLAYQNAHIFAICFSVAIVESFEHIRSKWLKEVRENGPKNAVLFLIGLQNDLRADESINKELRSKGLEMPTIDQCSDLAESIGAVSYFECSSKANVGFENILDAMKETVQNPIKIVRHASVSSPRGSLTGFPSNVPKTSLQNTQRTSGL